MSIQINLSLLYTKGHKKEDGITAKTQKINETRLTKFFTATTLKDKAEAKKQATHMGTFDRFKDLFRSEKKKDVLIKLWDELSSATDKAQNTPKQVEIFKQLKAYATRESQNKFQMALETKPVKADAAQHKLQNEPHLIFRIGSTTIVEANLSGKDGQELAAIATKMEILNDPKAMHAFIHLNNSDPKVGTYSWKLKDSSELVNFFKSAYQNSKTTSPLKAMAQICYGIDCTQKSPENPYQKLGKELRKTHGSIANSMYAIKTLSLNDNLMVNDNLLNLAKGMVGNNKNYAAAFSDVNNKEEILLQVVAAEQIAAPEKVGTFLSEAELNVSQLSQFINQYCKSTLDLSAFFQGFIAASSSRLNPYEIASAIQAFVTKHSQLIPQRQEFINEFMAKIYPGDTLKERCRGMAEEWRTNPKNEFTKIIMSA